MYGEVAPVARQSPVRSAVARAFPLPRRLDAALIAKNLTPGRSWSDFGIACLVGKRRGAVIDGAPCARRNCPRF